MAGSARREYGSLALVAAVLIAAVLAVRNHAGPLRHFIEQHPFHGVFLYIGLNIVDAVVAPGATLPLIPVAARAWGRVPAALVTIAGWTAGSLVAFLIARRWGYPIVRKIISIERVKRLKRYIPQNLFWSVVVLRAVMPMDALSYVLGLFTDMSWSSYIAATALGVAPSAFILATLGKLPHGYEYITIGIGTAVLLGLMFAMRRKRPQVHIPGFARPHGARR